MRPTVLATATSGSTYTTLLLYVAIGAAFYFLILRPQRNRAKTIQQAQASIGVGVDVITSSGMYGRIVAENEDNTVLLEIAPGVPIRIARTAILRAINPVVVDAEPDSDAPPASD